MRSQRTTTELVSPSRPSILPSVRLIFPSWDRDRDSLTVLALLLLSYLPWEPSTWPRRRRGWGGWLWDWRPRRSRGSRPPQSGTAPPASRGCPGWSWWWRSWQRSGRTRGQTSPSSCAPPPSPRTPSAFLLLFFLSCSLLSPLSSHLCCVLSLPGSRSGGHRGWAVHRCQVESGEVRGHSSPSSLLLLVITISHFININKGDLINKWKTFLYCKFEMMKTLRYNDYYWEL